MDKVHRYVPQDRKSTFESQIVKKRQKDISDIDQKIISMYAREFMFKHLEVKDGLSNNQVLDIFKDSEGFMWFATASGLNRYDGCQMTLFRSYNADPASLPDNYIKSIQEDYKGNLWILTGVGYVIYNSESETFDREVHASVMVLFHIYS